MTQSSNCMRTSHQQNHTEKVVITFFRFTFTSHTPVLFSSDATSCRRGSWDSRRRRRAAARCAGRLRRRTRVWTALYRKTQWAYRVYPLALGTACLSLPSARFPGLGMFCFWRDFLFLRHLLFDGPTPDIRCKMVRLITLDHALS